MAKITENFNRRRLLAIAFSTSSWILGWYALILTTDSINFENDTLFVKPNSIQLWGLFAAILISLAVWVRNCLTINVSHDSNITGPS
jgi:hypothetical protein